MARKVIPTREPQIDLFYDYLARIIGERSQSQFAKDANLTPAYVSNLVRGKTKIPNPETIKKIYRVNKDPDLNLAKFMESAGYDAKKYAESRLTAKEANSAILSALQEAGMVYISVQEFGEFDFCIYVRNRYDAFEYYEPKWRFWLANRFFKERENPSEIQRETDYLIGMVLNNYSDQSCVDECYRGGMSNKISIIVDDTSLYKEICQTKRFNLEANVLLTVILMLGNKIISEERLTTFKNEYIRDLAYSYAEVFPQKGEAAVSGIISENDYEFDEDLEPKKPDIHEEPEEFEEYYPEKYRSLMAEEDYYANDYNRD